MKIRAATSYAYRGVEIACTYWIIISLEPATRMLFDGEAGATSNIKNLWVKTDHNHLQEI